MDKAIDVDLFVEDRAFEEFLLALLNRVASQYQKTLQIHVRSARGGHARVLSELALYQKSVLKQVSNLSMPDLLVVGIDANCHRFHIAHQEIQTTVLAQFQHRTAIACPDPHIERWYLADPAAFHEAVGITPRAGRRKCEKDRYKDILAQAVAEAGHATMLGGIEFARDIVNALDFYRASKAERSFKAFLDELTSLLKTL